MKLTVLFLMCACWSEANQAWRVPLSRVELHAVLAEPYKTASLVVKMAPTNDSIETMTLMVNDRVVAIPREYYTSISNVSLWTLAFCEEIHRTSEGKRLSDVDDYLSIIFDSWKYDVKDGAFTRSRRYSNQISVLLDEYRCQKPEQRLEYDSRKGDEQRMGRFALYGYPLNRIREVKNIPVIPTNWVQQVDSTYAAWQNPDVVANGSVPMHHSKVLTFADILMNTGPLVAETDHYVSGKKWTDPAEVTISEYVRVVYSYEDESYNKNPWSAEALLQSSGTSKPKTLTLDEASAILKSWGIDRLSFNTKHMLTQAQSETNMIMGQLGVMSRSLLK